MLYKILHLCMYKAAVEKCVPSLKEVGRYTTQKYYFEYDDNPPTPIRNMVI